MSANEDQIKFWNEKAGQEWVVLQERMDANLAAIGDAVLALADAKPGEAVLDVGCGTGATSLALAQRGREGHRPGCLQAHAGSGAQPRRRRRGWTSASSRLMPVLTPSSRNSI